jgi:hypothetical protein
LLNRDLFDHYLYLWDEISGSEAPSGYLEGLIRREHALVDFLRAYAAHSDPAFYYDEGWWRSDEAGGRSMKVRLLEYFDLAGSAKAQAGSLLDNPPEWLSEYDRELLEAFLQSS